MTEGEKLQLPDSCWSALLEVYAVEALYLGKVCTINILKGCGAICFIRAIFYTISSYYMEGLQILGIDNETHLFSLEYVFLPRINASLEKFMLAWNNHPLRAT